MKQQVMSWKTKGMNRDLSVSAFNPEFSFENINLRLSTNEGNTFMSWVNEKGTKAITIEDADGDTVSISGIVVGTAVIDNKLILFTHNGSIDYIYKLSDFQANDDSTTDSITCTVLFSGNLGFDTEYPLETLVSYEASNIQKVYWTDGLNQPRVINIMKTYENNDNTAFDFIPTLDLSATEVTIEKSQFGGYFAPGVIQYCFSYVKEYGQQSNIFYVSPLYYLTHKDRGASPEDTVSNSFTITATCLEDDKFDYLRIYSIQRTSYNTTPVCRRLADVPIPTSGSITITDNGTSGDSIDPTELLYVGGKEITALTMTEKDGTLFMGNISTPVEDIESIQDWFDDNRGTEDFEHPAFALNKQIEYPLSEEVYYHTHTLTENQKEITTFKGGEYYRLGFQLQKETGEWTQPIFITDEQNTVYPSGETTVSLPTASYTVPLDSIVDSDELSAYQKIRPVIVYPTIADRTVICQGVLNSTVFNVKDRVKKTPFAQASWYFRPNAVDTAITVKSYYTLLVEFDLNSYPAALTDIISSREFHYGYTDENQTTSYGEISFTQAFSVTYPDDSSGLFCVFQIEVTSNNNNSSPWEDMLELSDVVMCDVDNNDISGTTIIGTSTAGASNICIELDSQETEAPGFDTINYNYTFSMTATKDSQNYACIRQFTQDTPGYSSGVLEGSSVIYTHLSTISQEAQDSKTIYSFPTQLTPWDDTTGNNQFLVDQSIVTLNSPDIDFDTQVQKIATDDLKLYIVGIIPITANVSSHQITTSALLETNHGDTSSSAVHKIGKGELDRNVYNINRTPCGGNRLLNADLWEDAVISDGSTADDVETEDDLQEYTIYPWHRTGSIIQDPRTQAEAASWLKTKKEANALFSSGSKYMDSNLLSYDCNTAIHLQENDYVLNYRLNKQSDSSSVINYYPNIDKVLNGVYRDSSSNTLYSLISMKYKSNSHAVIAMKPGEGSTIIPILPFLKNSNTRNWEGVGASYKCKETADYVFWGDTVQYSQDEVDSTDSFTNIVNGNYHDFLWIGELRRDVTNRFGGSTKEAVLANNWVVAGDAVNIEGNSNPVIEWTIGDTYYQRYDCLKTYPFTTDDTNQIVEILSFMCETHVNLDGRYDKNRGQIDNTNMLPSTFNLLNTVYSQTDNFFTYKKLDEDPSQTGDKIEYKNLVTYSKTKTSGADVDLWCNVTMASTLEFDGSKGYISKLAKLNNNILAFQEKGFSQLLYNENMQITTTEGTPVEIANSGKVQDPRYISDSIGCSNKHSLVSTPSGIYFMDANTKNIYLFNGQLENLSLSKGFNSWSKQNIPDASVLWNPEDMGNFASYYDPMNHEVLFVSADKCLAFSEIVNCFTSFYDYYGASYLCTLNNQSIWIKNQDSTSNLWSHQRGDYCYFFGKYTNYSTTVVANQEPALDKIFSNIELRASVAKEGYTASSTYEPHIPFDSLETWNDYQHGYTKLMWKTGSAAYHHYTGTAETNTFKRAFRMWRCDIPRDNVAATASQEGSSSTYTLDKDLGITRYAPNKLNRMRNPWLYIKLYGKASESTSGARGKVELHDLMAYYFT